MDEESIRRLWETTLSGHDPAGLDPNATYGSAGAPPGAAPGDATLPPTRKAAGDATLPPTRELRADDATVLEGPPPRKDAKEIETLAPEAEAGAPAGDDSLATRGPPDVSSADAPLHYDLVDVIGSGGMGVIYRARQNSLGRDVAIKKIHAHYAKGWRERFEAEARVTGLLDHPNIVPVHDLGSTANGDAFLAMKLVDGKSWKSLLHPDDPADARELSEHLRILISVCNAVAFAHDRGVSHNDLKPENVMLGEFGEILVMDWGLALDFREEPPADAQLPHKSTLEGPCGTPAYMAPELGRGEGAKLGPWTDVYLLGAILHELITGSAPHRGGSIHSVIARAILSAPPTFEADVPGELQEICRQAMARDPQERTPSARALRDALEAFLEHRESHRIAGAARELLDTCRASGDELSEASRSKLYADFSASIAGFAQARVLWEQNEEAAQGEAEAVLAFGEAALTHGDLGLAEAQATQLAADLPSTRDLRERIVAARRRHARAQRTAKVLRWSLAFALAGVVVSLSVGTVLVDRARDRAEANRAEAVAQAERAERESRVAKRRMSESLIAQGDMLGASVRWSEARDRYRGASAVLTELGLSTAPAELGLLEADRRSPRPLLTLDGEATCVAFSRDGDRLSAGGEALAEWDVLLGRALASRSNPARAVDVATSANGAVAVGVEDGSIRLWRSGARESIALTGHTQSVTSVVFTPSGELLVSASRDGTLRVWDVAAGAVRHVLRGHTGAVETVALTRLGRYAYSAGADGDLRRWAVGSGASDWVFPDAAEGATRLAFSPRGFAFAVAREDRTIRLWRWDRARNNAIEALRLSGHGGRVQALGFSPDGERLVSGGYDGQLRVWDAATGDLLRSISTTGEVFDLEVSPTGHRVAVALGDRGVGLWDLGLDAVEPTGSERNREVLAFAPRPNQPGVTGLTEGALSPSGWLAATGSADGWIVLWDAHTGLPLFSVHWHTSAVRELAFEDDSTLLSANAVGRQLWSLPDMLPSPATPSPPGDSTSSPAAWAAPEDVTTVIYAAEGGRRVLHPEIGAVSDVDLHPSGDRLLVVGERGARLWKLDRPSAYTRHERALAGARASLALDPDDADARSTLAAWYSFRGEQRAAIALWEEVAESGSAALGSTRGHWEQGNHRAALKALGRSPAEGRAAADWLSLSRAALTELEQERGSRLGRQPAPILALALSPDGNTVAATDEEGRVVLRRADSGVLLRRLPGFGKAAGCLAYDPDGAYLAWGDQGGRVHVWDARSDRLVHSDALHKGSVKGLAFAPDGSIVSASRSGVVRSRGETVLHTDSDLDGFPQCVAVSPDGELVAAGTSRGTVVVWGREGVDKRSWTADPRSVSALAFTPSGELITVSWRDKLLALWNPADGSRLRSLKAHGGNSLGLSADGRVAASSNGGELWVWDTERPEPLSTWKTTRGARAVAVSADGGTVLVGDPRGVVTLYSVPQPEGD